MRQENSYFGSIVERSKTLASPHPANSYAVPQLHDKEDRDINEDLESFAVDATNIEESPGNPVSSSHNERFQERNIAIQGSVSSLVTGHYESKTKELFLKTERETSGKDTKDKSNYKDKIENFVSFPAIPPLNIRDESSLGNKQVEGEEEEKSSTSSISPYPANLSEKELEFPLQLSSQRYWKTNESLEPFVKNVININQSAPPSELISNILRIEKPFLGNPNENTVVKSNNRDNSKKPFKEEDSHISVRAKENIPNIPNMKNSISAPAVPSGNVASREPSLIIKKIDIQIVDNRRTPPARTKKIDRPESDVLSRNYLWRFNIS